MADNTRLNVVIGAHLDFGPGETRECPHGMAKELDGRCSTCDCGIPSHAECCKFVAEMLRGPLNQPALADRVLELIEENAVRSAPSATAPITDNDRRWRHLEHGCQWVSWTETGGATHSFDPRHMTGLTHMRARADQQSAEHVKRLRDGADQLARQISRRAGDGAQKP